MFYSHNTISSPPQVHPCEAGLFLWCNISEHLKERTYAEELDFCEKLLSVGLWVGIP